jgi:hypothetical protein
MGRWEPVGLRAGICPPREEKDASNCVAPTSDFREPEGGRATSASPEPRRPAFRSFLGHSAGAGPLSSGSSATSKPSCMVRAL